MADYTTPCTSQNGYKRILVRAGFDPLRNYKPLDFLNKNLIGDNFGNLLFAYGAMNVLWTDNTSIKQIYDKHHYSEEDVDYINNNFDVFVMPMADAFRTSYITQLKSYTSLIRKLKIPVIVLGIGFRTTYEPHFCVTPELDTIVKQFVSAVLEHSSKLGLRGEITATYLSKLGFKEDRDYVPIGCPSLYTYGNKPHIRGFSSFDKIKRGKLIFNTNTWAKNHFNEFIPKINRFILDVVREVPDHYLIQQKIEEFKYLYFGKLYSSRVHIDRIFSDADFDRMHKDDRVKCFINVPSWIKFCEDADLFVGNRFHGAVAAILAGVPHIFLPFDGRTRELSSFHHFTTLSPDSIKEDLRFSDYLDLLDFDSFNKYQDANFVNYVDFLNKNGLQHIFDKQSSYKMGESFMEKSIIFVLQTINCMESLSLIEKTQRLVSVTPYIIRQIASIIKQKF